MSYVAAGVAVAGLTTSLIAKRKAKKAEKARQQELANLKAPDPTNVGEGLQVSTRGADLRRQEAGVNTTQAVEALRGGGARALIGGLPNVQAQNNSVASDIGANLDEQQKNIDQIKAQDNVRIQGVGEQRYARDVAGLSSQINAASDEAKQESANAMNYGMSAASGVAAAKLGASSKTKSTPSQVASYRKFYKDSSASLPSTILKK